MVAGCQVQAAELVQPQQVIAALADYGRAEDAIAGGLDQLVDQGGGGRIGDAAPAWQAATSTPISRWLLPVPESPSSTTG